MVIAAAALAAATSLLQPCRVEGVRRAAKCATVTVRENPGDATSRAIGLRVAVFPARSRNSAPEPVFVIVGGPGQGGVAEAGIVIDQMRGVEGDRDVVLFDPRGTGESNPLMCAEPHLVMRGARNAEFDACLQSLQRKADLRYYTTSEAAEDLEVVRRALGYERVDLIGISYGTRVAAAYIVRYPANVRAAVLRGALPIGANLLTTTARFSERSVQRVIGDCEKERECASAFPRLRRDLAAADAAVPPSGERVAITNSRTRRREHIELNYELYRDLLYSMMLHDVSRRSVPLLIHQVAQRGPHALAGPAALYLSAYDAVSPGAYYGVVCAEDDAALTDAERMEVDRLQRRSGRAEERCRDWPRVATRVIPAGVSAAVLVISGQDDPATPPENGAELARQIGGRHIVLPETSHAPLFPECARDIARDFLNDPTAKLDTRCLSRFHRLPFVLR